MVFWWTVFVCYFLCTRTSSLLKHAKDNPPKSSSIINGQLADENEFKYIVSIREKDVNKHYGGGSILSEKWILTARHNLIDTFHESPSFNFTEVPKILVYPKYYNSLRRYHNKVGYTAEKLFCHPISDDCRVYTTDSDIALIKLNHPIPLGDASVYNIQSIRRINHSLDFRLPYSIRVAGWGVTKHATTSPADKLRKLEVISFDASRRIHKYPYYRPDQQIPVWRRNQSFCKGDSGGPAVVIDTKTGRESLIGVIGYGARPYCREATFLQSVYYYREWISKVMENEEDKYLCEKLIGTRYSEWLLPREGS